MVPTVTQLCSPPPLHEPVEAADAWRRGEGVRGLVSSGPRIGAEYPGLIGSQRLHGHIGGDNGKLTLNTVTAFIQWQTCRPQAHLVATNIVKTTLLPMIKLLAHS